MTAEKAHWWQLYGLGALMVGALIWVHRLGLPEQAEVVLQIGVVVGCFGLILAWLGKSGLAFGSPAAADEAYPYYVIVAPARAEADLADAPGAGLGGDDEPLAVPAARLESRPEIVGSVLD